MHVMSFGGVVTKGSPKNCVLAAQNRPGSPVGAEGVFLFVTNGKDLYAVDFAHTSASDMHFGLVL
jgi:hypothetical protein